ncbi:prephenate dehydrogenase [Endothiovibrio diazotrophicus]
MPFDKPLIDSLCIVGVGLIGGSWARALREAGQVGEVIGCGREEGNLRRAVELGVIDRWSTDVAEAVAGCDLVVVAVPLGAMEAVFRTMAPALKAGAVVTDVGSAKGSVIEAASRAFGGGIPSFFVPGHPIAGREHSGVDAADGTLYRDRRVILTPLHTTDPTAIELVDRAWEVAGAEVVRMEVEHHDEVLAATSHLPHVLAFALVDSLANMKYGDEIFGFAAGGFRDFTRIASSDPVMWRDICLHNREALLGMVERFERDLAALRDLIAAGDGPAMLDLFQRAKHARDTHVVK